MRRTNDSFLWPSNEPVFNKQWVQEQQQGVERVCRWRGNASIKGRSSLPNRIAAEHETIGLFKKFISDFAHQYTYINRKRAVDHLTCIVIGSSRKCLTEQSFLRIGPLPMSRRAHSSTASRSLALGRRGHGWPRICSSLSRRLF